MTPYEWSTLAVSVLALVVSTIVLVVLLRQLNLLSRQVADSSQATDFLRLETEAENVRQRQRASMEFIAQTVIELQGLYNSLPPAGSPRLRKFRSDAMIQDSPAFIAVRNYLNYLEDLSVGVRLNILDESVVYQMIGGRMKRAWKSYRPWIEIERQKLNQTLFAALENCVTDLLALGE